MDPFSPRRLGSTGVMLPRTGFGGAPLGNLFAAVGEAEADATLDAAWTAGIRFYDTSPWYGRTLSEHRIGRALRHRPRDEFILSTKVGRLFRAPADVAAFEKTRATLEWGSGLPLEHVHDYSYDGIMRSYEDSLQRLGMNRVDMLVIHDLDLRNLHSEARVAAHIAELSAGGFRALDELRSSGLVRAIGCGVNDLGTIPRFLPLFDLDFVLLALRYTLGEQDTLESEIPLLQRRGIGIVAGGVFNSGLYATGPVAGARYNYFEPTAEVLERARRIEAVCLEFGVPLAAAALQFPLHHPSVASVIPGARSPGEVLANIDHLKRPIPDAFWQALRRHGLIHPDAPTGTAGAGTGP